jgi:hypothetical protein
MKADVLGLSRLVTLRLSLGAFVVAVAGLSLYIAGNLQGLTERALTLALDWAAIAATAGMTLAVCALILTILGPVARGRFSLLSMLAAVLVGAGSTAILMAVTMLRTVLGGMTIR